MNGKLNAVLLAAALAISASPAAAVTISWSNIGNPGNAADPADGDNATPGVQNFGAVPYAYRIGTYDVTVSQYVEFLNAKDPTGANTLGLRNDSMIAGGTFGSISFVAGNPNGGKY